MRILLINPNWALDTIKYSMSVLKPYKITPLELCNIAGGIASENEVAILDAFAEELTWQEFTARISNYKPDVCVVTTAPTYLFWRSCPAELSIPEEAIRVVRSASAATVIVIGPHGTITPTFVMTELKPDYLVRGECDLVVSELINAQFKDAESITGVCTVRGINQGIAAVADLDDIPLPRLDLLKLDLYEPHIWAKELREKVKDWKGRFIMAEASRGCPKRCVFCQREFYRKAYREKSADRMKAEIDLYSSLGVSYIYFIDETGSIFTPEKEEWLSYLGTKNIKFGIEAMIDQTTKHVVNCFKAAGCIYLEFGLETVDSNLHKMLMKNLSLENLDYIKEQIDTVVCFELNFYSPDYIELLGIKDIKQEALFNRPIIPYPGSPLGMMLMKKFQIPEQKAWDFMLRYVWWLQIEFFLNDNEIKNTGFREELFTKCQYPGFKEFILNGPYAQVKDTVYAVLGLSSFWSKNSSGFRD